MTDVRVEVLSRDGARVETHMTVRAGELLMDACERHGADVDFSCRAASCSTCRVEVVAGAEQLATPDEWERQLLEAVGNPSNTRFCCVARAQAAAAPGVVRVRPLGPAF